MNLQSTEPADAGWRAGSAAQATHSADFLVRQGAEPVLRRRNTVAAEAAEARHDVPVEELSFSALKTLREIDSIKYLRGELSLAESVLADPEFHALEKKEMSTEWSALSTAVTH